MATPEVPRLTNPMVEHLTGSLWMVTKPGDNANCLGRIYRDKQLALTHRDFNEVVVELRLADEPNACQCGHPMACHGEFSCQHYGCDCKGAAVKSGGAQ